MTDALVLARKAVNACQFGSPEWEDAMGRVRAMVAAQPVKASLDCVLARTSQNTYRAIAKRRQGAKG
jgi:hypothetical protein